MSGSDFAEEIPAVEVIHGVPPKKTFLMFQFFDANQIDFDEKN